MEPESRRCPFVPVGVPYELLHARTDRIDDCTAPISTRDRGDGPTMEQALFIDDDTIARPVPLGGMSHRSCVGLNADPNPT